MADACERVASDQQWRQLRAGQQYSADALQRLYPDDVFEPDFVQSGEFPFADPEKAEAYLISQALNRALVIDALDWLQRLHWRPAARSSGKLQEEEAPYSILRTLELAVDDTTFIVDDQEFRDLRFYPPSADMKAALHAAIREHAPQFDPTYHKLDVLRAEIARITGLKFNDTSASIARTGKYLRGHRAIGTRNAPCRVFRVSPPGHLVRRFLAAMVGGDVR